MRFCSSQCLGSERRTVLFTSLFEADLVRLSAATTSCQPSLRQQQQPSGLGSCRRPSPIYSKGGLRYYGSRQSRCGCATNPEGTGVHLRLGVVLLEERDSQMKLGFRPQSAHFPGADGSSAALCVPISWAGKRSTPGFGAICQPIMNANRSLANRWASLTSAQNAN